MNLIERAQQKLAGIQQRLRELQEERDQLDAEAAKWEAFIADAETLAAGDVSTSDRSLFPLAKSSHNGTHLGDRPQLVEGSHAAVAVQLILQNGPMTLDDLLEAMQKMGRGADDPNFRANVGSALWRRRKDVFTRKEKGPFGLRTRDFVFLPPPQEHPSQKGTPRRH